MTYPFIFCYLLNLTSFNHSVTCRGVWACDSKTRPVDLHWWLKGVSVRTKRMATIAHIWTFMDVSESSTASHGTCILFRLFLPGVFGKSLARWSYILKQIWCSRLPPLRTLLPAKGYIASLKTHEYVDIHTYHIYIYTRICILCKSTNRKRNKNAK